MADFRPPFHPTLYPSKILAKIRHFIPPYTPWSRGPWWSLHFILIFSILFRFTQQKTNTYLIGILNYFISIFRQLFSPSVPSMIGTKIFNSLNKFFYQINCRSESCKKLTKSNLFNQFIQFWMIFWIKCFFRNHYWIEVLNPSANNYSINYY